MSRERGTGSEPNSPHPVQQPRRSVPVPFSVRCPSPLTMPGQDPKLLQADRRSPPGVLRPVGSAYAVTSIDQTRPPSSPGVPPGETGDEGPPVVPWARPLEPERKRHPLGPLIERVAPDRPSATRAKALAVLAGGIALLAAAAWLEPDPSGAGTHRQAGMPTCNMLLVTGYPCPTCGMTTAFAHTVRGQWPAAFHAQPAGFLLALATILAVVLSVTTVVSGKTWVVNWYRLRPGRTAIAIISVFAVAWVYKIVAGLITGTLPVGR
jgi:hypothetical protein